MIKLLWIACSIFVFIQTLKYLIKEELKGFDEIEVDLLILYILLTSIIAAFGPIAILAYIIYNVLVGITKAINEGYKK